MVITWLKNKTKGCLVSISFLFSAIFSHFESALHITGLWLPLPRKNIFWSHILITCRRWDPINFHGTKTCYRWFPIISGHVTDKLFSLGFEILGLQGMFALDTRPQLNLYGFRWISHNLNIPVHVLCNLMLKRKKY